MTEAQAKAILFHSVFGTYKEDLSILEVVTEHLRWSTRSEMGDCMKGMGTSNKVVHINPIKFTY